MATGATAKPERILHQFDTFDVFTRCTDDDEMERRSFEALVMFFRFLEEQESKNTDKKSNQ
jgi:hypothetical protein